MNMAIDEALLEEAAGPVLRFYGWRSPSLSFGYFGRFADVAHERVNRDIVRRWTGGGIVMHGTDLTYSLILPRVALPAGTSARGVYLLVHGAINRALSGHLNTTLATADAPKVSDACFANPVSADVLVAGKKIAGAAQRRTRAGLLHQGSIQCANLPENFPDDLAAALCKAPEERDLTATVLQRAEELAALKYGARSWLQSR